MASREDLKRFQLLFERGKLPELRRELSRIKRDEIPRPILGEFASLSRQAGIPNLALKLLNPIVRRKFYTKNPANKNELAVYAASLISLGAYHEGLSILSKISEEEVPESLIYRVHGLMVQWNYRDSIPLLKKFLSISNISKKQEVIGKMNLAAALIHEKFLNEAIEVLENLRQLTSQTFPTFALSIIELCLQHSIECKDWKSTERLILEAEKKCHDQGSVEVLFLKKWRAIARFVQKPSANNLEKIAIVRNEAVHRQHWESVRHCDLFYAIAAKDEELILKVYFGTPFGAFRRHILHEYQSFLEIPKHFDWSENGENGELIDLTSGSCENRFKGNVGTLLRMLVSDFYRPFSVPFLHSKLYPGEFYNPHSGPNRVHQLVHRLSHILKREKVSFSVVKRHTGYAIRFDGPCQIRVPRRSSPFSPVLNHIRSEFGDEDFSCAQVMVLTGRPRRTISRLLGQSVQNGLLRKKGAGKATTYRFANAFFPPLDD